MKQIETRSTSSKTAECNPVLLREGDNVRLVFVPTLVDNSADPEACVRGHFVYEKKRAKDQWAPITGIPLSSLKGGEGFKLGLHSRELLDLFRALEPLYGLYRQRGIPRGRQTFVRLRSGLARFLALGEADMTDFLESHKDDAVKALLKLTRWLATSPRAGDVASSLAAMAPGQLPELTTLIGIAAFKSALSLWEKYQTNSVEEFWQRALEGRTYVLSQLFARPVVVIKSKAYVGGKDISNRGGNVADFLVAAKSTDAVALVEIKTPQTPLLGAQYRDGVFPLSRDVMGAVAQALKYRQALTSEFHRITAELSKPFTLGEPRCVIVAGHAARELTVPAKRESFELQRERLQGVSIVTYDELFGRLDQFVHLLQGDAA